MKSIPFLYNFEKEWFCIVDNQIVSAVPSEFHSRVIFV